MVSPGDSSGWTLGDVPGLTLKQVSYRICVFRIKGVIVVAVGLS